MPNIFDAHVFPDLLLPIVLGNLLSPNLWDFSARIQARCSGLAGRQTADEVAMDSLPPILRTIQHQIDRHFEHLTCRRVGEVYGLLDLDEERQRLGTVAVDGLVGLFQDRQRSFAALHDEAAKSILEDLSQSRFPAYYYTNFDVVRANRRLVHHKSRSPMGLTSCLDEVAIFAALAMTLPKEPVETVIALANPTHYTAFGWGSDGNPWWFYGKNALYSMDDWRHRATERTQGDMQACFDEVLAGFDRIIAVSGTFDFQSGKSSVPEEHLEQFVSMIDMFFGVRLRQLETALGGARSQLPESPLAPVLRELLGSKSIETARARLLNSPEESLQMVQYSYRSLDVPDHGPYLRAARQSPWAKRAASSLSSAAEAVDSLKNIPGLESIFQDRDRIAMPEETLRLMTGSDRDKALLLHILIEHVHRRIGNPSPVATLLTKENSFVVTSDFCFNLTTMCPAEPPDTGVIVRFSDPEIRPHA